MHALPMYHSIAKEEEILDVSDPETQFGSPWDSLLSSSPALSTSASTSDLEELDSVLIFPRLTPEIEEGAVEYKLQLLAPTPDRFARLVTQLKWRLLEGAGQAYYELGVADSGQLVGLSRVDLERTLETLEMMAGEIGASVIVVKEIELPAEFGARPTSTHIDGACRMPNRRQTPLNPPELEDETESDSATIIHPTGTPPLEIAEVYKPRPMQARFPSPASSPVPVPSTRPGSARDVRRARARFGSAESPPKEKKAFPPPARNPLERRIARDRRRAERRAAQLMLMESATQDPTPLESVAAAVEEVVEEVTRTAPWLSPLVPTGPGLRLIVEALVVRKQSIDDSMLDFGGLSTIRI